MSEPQTNLASYDNRWYQPGPVWKRFLWFVAGRIFVNSNLPIPGSIRILVLKLFGARIGPGVVIKPKVNVKYPWFLSVENNTWIGENVWIDNLTDVEIGANVCISQGAMLLTGNHNYKKRSFDLITGKITIHEGAWIGAQAVVCPGVTCGSHSVLAVNSTATKNLEPYGIYQGNPAVFVRTRIITE